MKSPFYPGKHRKEESQIKIESQVSLIKNVGYNKEKFSISNHILKREDSENTKKFKFQKNLRVNKDAGQNCERSGNNFWQTKKENNPNNEQERISGVLPQNKIP